MFRPLGVPCARHRRQSHQQGSRVGCWGLNRVRDRGTEAAGEGLLSECRSRSQTAGAKRSFHDHQTRRDPGPRRWCLRPHANPTEPICAHLNVVSGAQAGSRARPRKACMGLVLAMWMPRRVNRHGLENCRQGQRSAYFSCVRGPDTNKAAELKFLLNGAFSQD